VQVYFMINLSPPWYWRVGAVLIALNILHII
jgi:hypothetical protein